VPTTPELDDELLELELELEDELVELLELEVELVELLELDVVLELEEELDELLELEFELPPQAASNAETITAIDSLLKPDIFSLLM
jgi:hypothetical protein